MRGFVEKRGEVRVLRLCMRRHCECYEGTNPRIPGPSSSCRITPHGFLSFQPIPEASVMCLILWDTVCIHCVPYFVGHPMYTSCTYIHCVPPKSALKDVHCAGEMAQQFRTFAVLFLQRAQVLFPAPSWQLTTAFDFRSKGSSALF